jgi:hypothetical protein
VHLLRLGLAQGQAHGVLASGQVVNKTRLIFVFLWMLTTPVVAAELDPRAAAAFDRYVSLTMARMASEIETGRIFLRVDGLPEAARKTRLDQLKRGQVAIDKLETREGNESIVVPKGVIHHWIGVVFVPGATVDRTVELLQDYNHHAQLFAPTVVASTLRSRDGDMFRFHLRFYMKRVIAVTLNTEHEARFFRPAADRAYSQIVSTRIAEVEYAGTAREAEKPVGTGGGFMWRFNTYWRFFERDGGTYVQCESLTLSRDIPFALRWIVGPFVNSIPRESLTGTLDKVRKELLKPRVTEG